MKPFKGQTENARHFLQPATKAMGHKVIRLLLFGLCVHWPDCGVSHARSLFGQGLSTSEPSANIPRQQKKPTLQNTRRYSTTSAYYSKSSPPDPSCSSSSRPTTSGLFRAEGAFEFAPLPADEPFYDMQRKKQGRHNGHATKSGAVQSVRSKRSRVMTLSHAATKSRTNAS